MVTPILPTCPKCGQTDQIQKVTSVYAGNTKEWTESHTRTDAWGDTETVDDRKEAHTSLGLKLHPPQQPTGPTHPGLWYGIGAFIVIVFGSVLCPIALVPLGLLIPVFTGSAFLPDISGIPAWQIAAIVIGAASLCLGVLGLGLLIWLGLKIKNRFARDMKDYRDKKAAFDAYDLPRWQRAKSRWEQLFFCMRDETIFIPSENRAVKADDMEKYLDDPYFRSE